MCAPFKWRPAPIVLTTTIFLRHFAVKFVVGFILLLSPPNFRHPVSLILSCVCMLLMCPFFNLCILVILE